MAAICHLGFLQFKFLMVEWAKKISTYTVFLKQLNMILQPTSLVLETDQKKLQSDNVFIY